MIEKEHPTWEEYVESHKEQRAKEEIQHKIHRIVTWANKLEDRITHKKSGINNAIEGVKSSLKDIEELIKMKLIP